MSEIRIIDLPESLTIADDDYFLLEQGDGTKRAKGSIINKRINNNASQLAEMTREIEEARVDYFGKEHASLKEKEDREFEYVHIDNTRGMFVEQSTDTGSMKIENSIEGRARDTVLKGRTLQNLCPFDFPIDRWSGGTSTWMHTSYKKFDMLQPEKTYSILVYGNISNFSNYRLGHANDASQNIMTGNKIGIFVSFKFKEVSGVGLIFNKTVSEGYTQAEKDSIKCIILEGDHTANPPTSYFESIKSLGEEENKISILSTGKNLFDMKKASDNFLNAVGGLEKPDFDNKLSDFIEINSSNKYSYSYKNYTNIKGLWTGYCFYKEKNVSSIIGTRITNTTSDTFTITPPTDAKYIRIGSRYLAQAGVHVQLEEGEVSTTYISHEVDKKDILLPVEGGAKGLPNGICDELFENGDYLQNVDILSFTGFENNWIQNSFFGEDDEFISFSLDSACLGVKSNSVLICNLLSEKKIDTYDGKYEGIIHGGRNTGVTIKRSKLETPDVIGFKKLLQKWNTDNAPLTVYYELAEPILHKPTTPTDLNPATFKEITHVSCLNKIAPSELKASFPINVGGILSRLNEENKTLEKENDLFKDNQSFLASVMLNMLSASALPSEVEEKDLVVLKKLENISSM